VIVERIPCHLVELTPRQHQIALMVARGRTNHAIANALGISVWTVSTHLRRIFAKLTVSSRAEMVVHLLAKAEFVSQIDQRPLA
jgi:DNA-binding CsgD family transcriptional regulator